MVERRRPKPEMLAESFAFCLFPPPARLKMLQRQRKVAVPVCRPAYFIDFLHSDSMHLIDSPGAFLLANTKKAVFHPAAEISYYEVEGKL